MIAGQVGYSTAFAFGAAFRREYGIPPGIEQPRHQARQDRIAFDITDATVIELSAHVGKYWPPSSAVKRSCMLGRHQ